MDKAQALATIKEWFDAKDIVRAEIGFTDDYSGAFITVW